ncbi:MAG: sugar transferase [Desulfosporosinus sp.]
MYREYIKRLFDIILALIGLPLFVLVLILVTPAIYFTDKGPIFYNANRIGKNGKLFKMFKFRSMTVNAPDIRLADGSTYSSGDDPRLTRVGRFLRKTSLDEVPQILNVLFGTMSIIGPRPDPPDWLEKYDENDAKYFLSVRPGISGYNQAYFRNLSDGAQKIVNDVYYAKRISFILDIKIFWRTVLMVLGQKNLYKEEENATVKIQKTGVTRNV